jgi:hypothetical protein
MYSPGWYVAQTFHEKAELSIQMRYGQRLVHVESAEGTEVIPTIRPRVLHMGALDRRLACIYHM